MGSTRNGNEQPVHTVNVPDFEMTRTEVTVAQHGLCRADGGCPRTPADWSADCYWNRAGFEKHPVNCVTWEHAEAFCSWAGGRLPSESEWEYAARSRGKDHQYPWGNDPMTCDRAIISSGGNGCGQGLPWAVCSKPPGHTEQGLCDMVGNVLEWVADAWHANYTGAPDNGSAWGTPGLTPPRGGSFAGGWTATRRGARFGTDYQNTFTGFRCVRNAR